jgi:hypothetical protein
MSFQNSVLPDGSININVIPSFGRIINCSEVDKQRVVNFYPYYRFLILKDGKPPTDQSFIDQLISTHQDTFLSVLDKLSKNQ